MKLLADENIELEIVEWLRGAGHDVVYAAEAGRGTSDADWMTLAASEDRSLITSDLDYGELVRRQEHTAPGILLLRFRGVSGADRVVLFASVWTQIAASLIGHFIVATPRRIRIRPLAL